MINKFNINGKELFPIGLGTFGFGEEILKDKGITEQEQIESMKYSLSKGVNYVVGYMTYANGNAVKLLAQSIKDFPETYLTFCAYPSTSQTVEDAIKNFSEFQTIMGRKEVDTFMVSSTMEGRLERDGLIQLLEYVLEKGYTKTLGINNFNLEQLNYYHSIFKDKIVLHEICHNFEVRVYDDLGIIERGKELGIQHIIYQGLRRNRTALRNWPVLVELAAKYGVTQNQIILNWLYNLGHLTLVKAGQIDHIDENLASLSFSLSQEDVKLITDSAPMWELPVLNWQNFDSEGDDGLYVAKLSNVFDDLNPKTT